MSDRLVAKTFSQLKKMYKQSEFSIQHGTVCLEPRDIVENMLELEELTTAKQRVAELERQNALLHTVAIQTYYFANATLSGNLECASKNGLIYMLNEWKLIFVRVLQEAIDGGALEDSDGKGF